MKVVFSYLMSEPLTFSLVFHLIFLPTFIPTISVFLFSPILTPFFVFIRHPAYLSMP